MDRGQWRQLKSVRRYKKSGRYHRELAKLSPQQLAAARAAEKFLQHALPKALLDQSRWERDNKFELLWGVPDPPPEPRRMTPRVQDASAQTISFYRTPPRMLCRRYKYPGLLCWSPYLTKAQARKNVEDTGSAAGSMSREHWKLYAKQTSKL